MNIDKLYIDNDKYLFDTRTLFINNIKSFPNK